MKTIFRAATLAAFCCLFCVSAFAADGETLYDSEYCFSETDFMPTPDTALSGILVTNVPDSAVAAIKLGKRSIRAGDVLPQSVLAQLTMQPACAESCNAVLEYQPIRGTVLGAAEQLTIRIQSGKNETPTANDAELETYKNIPNNGTLTASDPENGALTFQLVEQPKRGEVTLNADGTFVYTPEKNKVGDDRFTFTATDDAGNVSKPAAVHIRILKPTDRMTFADVAENEQFEALWSCEAGLTSGRSIGGVLCYCPNESVSRAEFLVMAMSLCDIPTDDALTVSGFDDADLLPAWQQTYLASAMRRGLVRGEATESGLFFRPNDPITAQEAAVIVQAVLELPTPVSLTDSDVPVWARGAVQALSDAGIALRTTAEPLTRMEVAELLYHVSKQ